MRPLILASVFIIALAACSPAPKTPNVGLLPVVLTYGDTPIACSKQFRHSNDNWRIDDLRLFIHQLNLSNGIQQQSLTFIPDDRQTVDVAMLVFTCKQRQLVAELALNQAPDLSLGLLSFKVGVPFELNHQNPLTQSTPLNIPSMFWSWQGGHKFLRLDMTSNTDNFIYHLGSTGCQSASRVRAPQQPCSQANVVDVTVRIKPKQSLTFDLKKLLSGVAPSKNTSCMYLPEQLPACQRLSENLHEAFGSLDAV